MYSDNTLTPREAVRLCALGTLAAHSDAGTLLCYDELVHAVRHFVSRITGPSLELMGESIELLKYEGLVEADTNADQNNPVLTMTVEGQRVLDELLHANIRAGSSDLNELVIALKFRFLHQLPLAEQLNQIDLMLEVSESEIARFEDLRHYHDGEPGYLTGWLDHDVQRLESRIEWLVDFKSKLSGD